MRILQVTNIVSHHQLPLARRFADVLGDNNFRFAATQAPMPERQQLGWRNEETEPWILRAGESDADYSQFMQWWENADVVICGERLIDKLKNRIGNSNLTFYMTERWLKPPLGIARLIHPRFAIMVAQFRKLSTSPFFHCLPIGHYSAIDMKRIARFRNRMWLWGYFTTKSDTIPDYEKAGKSVKVLWCGRMLEWKRVDILIRAFSSFQAEHSDAILTLVGYGPKRKSLERLARKLLLPGSFHCLPPQSVTEVLKLMREHHIYVLTSSGYEGWGAVINEAMEEGCVVIASEATGAGKTLIRNEENGLLIKCGDWKMLGNLLSALSKNPLWRIKLAKEGQRTIEETWSPKVAANRFISVCDAIIGKKVIPLFKTGPMSII